MAVTADSVLVEIEAKLDKFNRDVAVAAGSFEAQAARMGKAATGVEMATQKAASGLGTLKAAALGFASVVTVDKIIQIASASLDYAASLGETAQQLGVSTKALQELSFAASQAGIDQATLEAGLARLTKTLGEAKLGGDKQVEAFKAVGVTFQELAALTPDEALRRVADGLQKIEDPAKRAAAEVDLFGKSGQKLDTLLSGGTKALDELAVAAQRLGVVLSDDQIQKADIAADKLDAVKKVLSANIAGVVADNADAILKVADAIGVTVSGLAELIRLVERADKIKARLESGDLRGAARDVYGFAGDSRLNNLDKKFPLPSFARQAPAGGGDDGGGGNAPPPPPPRPAAKPELTPAEQRLFGNDTEKASLGIDTTQTIADLDTIAAKFGEVQTIAVDISNADIINPEAVAAAKELAQDLSDGLALAIINGQSLGDALVNSIEAASAKLISSGLFKLLGVGIDALLGPGLGTGIGKLLGFANGGRPPVGRASIVGERGPELFVPDSAGKIIPNHQLGGGGGASFVQNISVSLAGNAATREDVVAISRIAQESTLQIIRQSQQFGVPSL